MLDASKLKQNLLDLFNQTIPSAFEQAMLETMPEKSDVGDKIAKQFGETLKNMLAEQWAETIAQAIDYYVKNATITGTILTVGSPVTQTAQIMPAPMPATAGKIPNTLGIQ